MSHVGEVEAALADIARARSDGLAVPDDPFLQSQQDRLVAFAKEHRLPAIYGVGAFIEAGGPMSYSASIFDVWRRGASYVDRISTARCSEPGGRADSVNATRAPCSATRSQRSRP